MRLFIVNIVDIWTYVLASHNDKMKKSRISRLKGKLSPFWTKMMNVSSRDTRNILEVTSFTRWIFRMFGVDAYDYTLLPKNKVKASISPLGLVSCVSFYFLYVWCTLYATIHRENVMSPLYTTMLGYYGEYMETFLSFLLVTYTSLCFSFRKTDMCYFFEEILNIDQTIREVGMKLDEKSVRLHLFLMSGWHIVAGGAKYFALYFTFRCWNLDTPICKTAYMMYTFNMMMMCLMKFFCVNIILEIRYRCLNKTLLSVVHGDDGNGMGGILLVQEAGSQNRKSSSLKESTALEKVRVVSGMYSRLHRLQLMINEKFGTQIVLLLLMSFIAIILSLFYVMEATAGGLLRYFKRYCFFVFFNIQTAAFNNFVVYFIVYVCDKVYSETARTAGIVHDIINHQISEDVTEAASYLSLQLLHQKTNFSAKGLLKLNRELLLSVSGSVTTYLIILMQFATGGTIYDIVDWDHGAHANATTTKT